MSTLYIPIKTLCTNYKVETSFFENLSDYGLIEVTTIESSPCIHEDQIQEIEKMIRMHQELHLNFEGIDTVFNLLERIEDLQTQLQAVKIKLERYKGTT